MHISSDNKLGSAALEQRLAYTKRASGPAALFQNFRVFAICLFACIGGLLYGYNQGVFSGLLTMTSFGDHMGDYISNSTKKGWLTSILELGAWTGTLYSGFLAEIISRKYAIMVNIAIFMIGVVVQCTATTSAGHNSILGGRFITGMGVGSLSMIVPMYVAECAPPEMRGLLIGLQQFAIEFGILISFWIDYGTNFIGGTGSSQSDASWLVPLALQLGPAIVLFVGMIFMPFSPRWLVHHGQEEQGKETLALLRKCPMDDPALELEFLEIRAQSLFDHRTVATNFPHLSRGGAWNTVKLQFVSIASLFKTKSMFKRVIVSTVVMFFQQWTGINAILYYAPSIFHTYLSLGSNTVSLLATGVVGIAMFLATIPAVLYIDKLGRKPVLALGAIAMGICHIIVAILIARNSDQWVAGQNKASAWAAVVMIWLFVVHFGWSWGPCAWIVVAEVWPISTRPYGIALGASSNWMNNFIVGQVTPDMLSGMGYGTFIFFGVMIFIGAAFIWFYVPETKQLTLEEMDLIFGSSGVAAADTERMEQIHREIGLSHALGADTGSMEKDGSPSRDHYHSVKA